MPLSRLSICLKCRAELYVCRLCGFHDPKLRHGCREERAEHVQDKERANFCEFFQARPGAYAAKDTSPAAAAHAELDALFGAEKKETPAADPARAELDKLFGKK